VPFPAYDGVQFYFHIVVSHLWHHEFAMIDRNTGQPMEFDSSWQGLCRIRDEAGTMLAELSDLGADGTVTFSTGLIELDLPAEFTLGLTPTTSYRPGPSKSFVYADVSLMDPDSPVPFEPYILARGKGVIYLPTTVPDEY
jgi:hypothetical protein